MRISFLFASNEKWWAFLSPVIMSVSKTDFSHCAILVEWKGISRVYHSDFPSGKSLEYSEWLKTYKVKHKFSAEINSIEERFEIGRWLNKEVIKNYSVLQLILILIYKASPKYRPTISSWIINGDYRDICSEFMASFMVKFFGVRFEKSDDIIDLNDVFEMAKQIEWSRKSC